MLNTARALGVRLDQCSRGEATHSAHSVTLVTVLQIYGITLRLQHSLARLTLYATTTIYPLSPLPLLPAASLVSSVALLPLLPLSSVAAKTLSNCLSLSCSFCNALAASFNCRRLSLRAFTMALTMSRKGLIASAIERTVVKEVACSCMRRRGAGQRCSAWRREE